MTTPADRVREPLQALPLRPYQREALDALSFTEDVRRLAIVLPTGAGKTVCFAHDAMEWLRDHPGDRVLVLVDLDELVWQAHEKITGTAPHLKVGVVKAGRNDVTADVIVASVQTLRNPARLKQIRGVGRVIVDECEAAASPTYMKVLTALGCFRPGGAVAVGFTATLMRGDGKGLGHVWQDVAFQRDLSWMIRHRYLVPFRGLAVEVPDLDLAKVRATRTDYRDGELGEALAESLAPQRVAEAIIEHAPGRKGILFAPTVASAEVFAGALREAGLTTGVVHGGMPVEERRAILRQHKAGLIQWLCNCMILTKGYDDPTVDCIVVARPTKSKRLYIQMAGRGGRVDPSRPYEDQDCLLLDVVGASGHNDLRSLADLSIREIKNPRSGRTIVELEDDLDDGGGVEPDEVPYWTGPVRVREFDPLGRPSTKTWLRTRGGTFFVPAGTTHYVFIMEYPEPGRWSVCQVPVSGGRPQMSEHRGLPLDQALVWAEDMAVRLGADLNRDRSAPWRRKRASDKTVALARNLGITPHGHNDLAGLWVCDEKAGDLADRIAECLGSSRIDPIVKAVRSK